MKLKFQFFLVVLSVTVISQNVQAQAIISTKKEDKQKTVKVKPAAPAYVTKNEDTKNLVKLNLTALALRNFSFQYERAIGSKISAVMGLKFMAKGKLPLINQIKSRVDAQSFTEIEKLNVSSTVITPEIRYYFGEDVFRGFYVAPFARFGNFKADLPVEYSYTETNSGKTFTETIPLNGKINGITGGLMIGAQWKLSKLLYLDWWILGPHYGSAKGDIVGFKSLSADEQNGLKEELDDLLSDSPIEATSTVDANGARLDFKGPFGGIRAGICLGVRF